MENKQETKNNRTKKPKHINKKQRNKTIQNNKHKSTNKEQ